jgi:uncharacterized protein
MKHIDLLEQYLLNTKVDATELDNRIKDERNNLLPRRDIYQELSDTAKNYFTSTAKGRMIVLRGFRGVGKTTLMWQLAKEIFDKYCQDIYSFNLDSLQSAFRDINLSLLLENFRKVVLKKKFIHLENPIVFLFDEIHIAAFWSTGLKVLFDECPQAFIICTGSSALQLYSTADLVSRWIPFRISPFSFTEYIQMNLWRVENTYNRTLNLMHDIRNINSDVYLKVREKNIIQGLEELVQKAKNKKQITLSKKIQEDLKEILFFSDNIHNLEEKIKKLKQPIEDYLKKINNIISLNEYVNYYNIPRLFGIENQEKIFEITLETLKVILYQDIPSWLGKFQYDIEDILKIEKLLTAIALNQETNLDKLSDKIGCTYEKRDAFIKALVKAEVLNEFSQYGNDNTKLNKNKKYFFLSPTLRLALQEGFYGHRISSELQGKLYEEIVAIYLKRLFPREGLVSYIYSQNNSRNPDFVIETRTEDNDKVLVLEVKKGKKDTEQITQCRIEYRYGILVSAAAKDFEIVGNVLVIPLAWFLLL